MKIGEDFTSYGLESYEFSFRMDKVRDQKNSLQMGKVRE